MAVKFGKCVVCDSKKLTEGKLPEIKDGVKVRSTLRTEDLRLIRKGFVALIKSQGITFPTTRYVAICLDNIMIACETSTQYY